MRRFEQKSAYEKENSKYNKEIANLEAVIFKWDQYSMRERMVIMHEIGKMLLRKKIIKNYDLFFNVKNGNYKHPKPSMKLVRNILSYLKQL